jgi:Amt family ammonium transporter
VGIVGALVIGFVAGFACLWGVNGLKRLLGADDSLDVFGVHGVGGIVGALLTACSTPGARRPRPGDRLGHGVGGLQRCRRAGVDPGQGRAADGGLVGRGGFVAYKIVDLTIGLRVPEDEEREGLDISSHGETAYNK